MPDTSPIGSFATPSQTLPGQYPYINVEQTEGGHIFMMDDTPDNESIRLQHGKTGTYYRQLPDGSVEHIIQSDHFMVIVNDNNVKIQGVCNISIEGDSKLHVYGDCFTQVDGDMTATVNGDQTTHAVGDVDLTSEGNVSISAGNPGNLGSFNMIYLAGTGGVQIQGDLTVTGTISGGADINATTNVTAAQKVFALGGIETLGGINVGFSTPGPYVPTGIVTALTEMTAPFIQTAFLDGGVVSDAGGPMMVLRSCYDSHNHIAPYGPTSSTLMPC
jgi:hypothetical protein